MCLHSFDVGSQADPDSDSDLPHPPPVKKQVQKSSKAPALRLDKPQVKKSSKAPGLPWHPGLRPVPVQPPHPPPAGLWRRDPLVSAAMDSPSSKSCMRFMMLALGMSPTGKSISTSVLRAWVCMSEKKGACI